MFKINKKLLIVLLMLIITSTLPSCKNNDKNIKTYTITYVTNGGTLTNQPLTYDGTVDLMLTAPVKEGYIFKGWYDNELFNGQSISIISKGESGDKTFYAKWGETEKNQIYLISFITNGGLLLDQPINYDGSQDIVLPIPTKEGYIFDGWYETNDFTGDVVDKIEKGSTGNKVYYAKWSEIPTPETYYITFVTNGGILLEYFISYDETQEIVLPTPTKAGYTFEGWYETSDFTDNVINKLEKGTTGNKALFAKWEATMYLITYITNKGNLSNAPVNYNILQTVILPTPTRDGYRFVGWYDNAQFNGNAITSILEGSIGNKEFYAKWEKVSYLISYNTNGGVLNNAPVNYDITQNVVLPIPTKKGYNFVGWYDNDQFIGDKITSISEGSIGDKEFFAKWEKEIYTITFVLNGGSLSDFPKEYDIDDNVSLPTPTREGYKFVGWYDNAQFAGLTISDIVKGSTGDKTFYAKWAEESTTSDGRPWELNRCGFDGQSMNYLIKVLPVAKFDPYDAGYTGTKQALKQAHQADVEDAYNINIVYSAWDNDAQWGPARVEFIKYSFINSSFQKKNVYAIDIASYWIPTLVKENCLAELYNYDTGEGIFADYEYGQDSTFNEAAAVKGKIYGYKPGAARPDYFLYYNATKIASIGMEDPAEMWFRGEWTWSNFDKWVREAQVKLGSGEYAIDCGYAEFIIGAAPAQGAQLINSSLGTIMFTKSSVTNIVDKMKAYYKEGYWDTRHGVQDVSTNFKAGKTLIHTGSLWFLKESTRFKPEGEENGIQFKMGVVPYPIDDNTTVIPYTEPYSYEDTEGNLVEVTEPLKTRTNETLTTKTGEPIYGIDLSESNFKIPYTGENVGYFSLINYDGSGQNGMNPSTAFCILHDLLSDMAPDPDDEGLTSDDAYRIYLNKKLDYSIDVEVVMSVQDSSLSYYELMETLSTTVGGGSNFGPNGFWIVASGMMSSEDTPATKLKEIETPYKQALESIGY